jgi:hypothetical protein
VNQSFVMCGLGPRIHVLRRREEEGVDGEDEPGHDAHILRKQERAR